LRIPLSETPLYGFPGGANRCVFEVVDEPLHPHLQMTLLCRQFVESSGALIGNFRQYLGSGHIGFVNSVKQWFQVIVTEPDVVIASSHTRCGVATQVRIAPYPLEVMNVSAAQATSAQSLH